MVDTEALVKEWVHQRRCIRIQYAKILSTLNKLAEIVAAEESGNAQ
jgi:hypothetical protein